jgi:hypothetical protein
MPEHRPRGWRAPLLKNARALKKEYQESVEMFALLIRHVRRPLNRDERERVRRQAVDLLKILPVLLLLLTPAKFVVLPVLLKVLPRSAFPSAFSEID